MNLPDPVLRLDEASAQSPTCVVKTQTSRLAPSLPLAPREGRSLAMVVDA